MPSEHLRTLTDTTFDAEVLASPLPVVVDFWAAWCMPCRVLAPTIDELATEFAGRARVGKLDTDANKAVSDRFQISAIPTVIIFKDGKVARRFVGLTKKEELAAAVRDAMST
jgi:thioredoxin 1